MAARRHRVPLTSRPARSGCSQRSFCAKECPPNSSSQRILVPNHFLVPIEHFVVSYIRSLKPWMRGSAESKAEEGCPAPHRYPFGRERHRASAWQRSAASRPASRISCRPLREVLGFFTCFDAEYGQATLILTFGSTVRNPCSIKRSSPPVRLQ